MSDQRIDLDELEAYGAAWITETQLTALTRAVRAALALHTFERERELDAALAPFRTGHDE